MLSPATSAPAKRSYSRAALLPMPHVIDVLTDLGRPYCLASSSDSERIRISLAVTRLAHFFEGRIFTAAMVERAKPAPDLFLLAATRMGAPPAQTLVVEDSVNGVLAAKAAGMAVWGFTGGSHYAGLDMAPALKAAGADRVFHSMAEFRAVTTPGREAGKAKACPAVLAAGGSRVGALALPPTAPAAGLTQCRTYVSI